MPESIARMETRLAAIEELVNRLVRTIGSVDEPTGRAGAADSAEVLPEEWETLGAKLDRFESELNDKEKAMMLTILGAASASFEQGGLQESPALARSRINLRGDLARVRLSDALISIGNFSRPGIGGFGGTGPIADSVNVGGDLTSIHGDWTKDLDAQAAITRGRWNTRRLGALGAGMGGLRGGTFER